LYIDPTTWDYSRNMNHFILSTRFLHRIVIQSVVIEDFRLLADREQPAGTRRTMIKFVQCLRLAISQNCSLDDLSWRRLFQQVILVQLNCQRLPTIRWSCLQRRNSADWSIIPTADSRMTRTHLLTHARIYVFLPMHAFISYCSCRTILTFSFILFSNNRQYWESGRFSRTFNTPRPCGKHQTSAEPIPPRSSLDPK